MSNQNTQRRRHLRFPHTFVLIFLIAALTAVMANVVPAGQYDRVLNEATGRTVVEPSSFHYVEKIGCSITDFFRAFPQAFQESAQIMFFIAFLQPFQCGQFVLAGSLRGAGDTRATAVITLITVMIVRPGLGYLLVYVFDMGLFGAWYAIAADQLLRTILVTFRYFQGKWMFTKVKNA